jgi:hypothetical protein
MMDWVAAVEEAAGLPEPPVFMLRVDGGDAIERGPGSARSRPPSGVVR